MAYALVIVESPAKAKTIGKMLGRYYKVLASGGHVRDIPKSTLGVDIEHGFTPKYITLRGKGEILDDIRRAARAATRVYLATDPDREGEAISWHLAVMLGIDPASDCRVTFPEITESTVKRCIHEARPIDMELVTAQQARRVLDRLIGYQVSGIMWKKVSKNLSAGRVQSAAARIICDREREITAFVPEEYWTIRAELRSATGQTFFAGFTGTDGEKRRLSSRAEAEAMVAASDGAANVLQVKRSPRHRHAAPPFTTSSLQQEASRKHNFTTKKTMSLAQQLYEGVNLGELGTRGLISYIRTDSVRIAPEAQQAAMTVIREKFGDAYVPETPNQYAGRQNAQDAHEAIRPADVSIRPEDVHASLSRDQYRLYKLVYERFLASQMTDAVYDTMQVDVALGDCRYRANGQAVTFDGFTRLYSEGSDQSAEEENGLLPDLKEGDALTPVSEPVATQHFTQPPARYTEATLVRTLEENGIGRPSTYAPTISTIIERRYVVREKKQLKPTELGFLVDEWLGEHFPDIVDAGFTADMETELDRIGEGSGQYETMLSAFYGPFTEELTAAQASDPIRVPDRVSEIPCPNCGRMLVYKLGKFGEFLACPGYPECRHTETIIEKTGIPCTECGGEVILRPGKNGKRFYGCNNYPACTFSSWDRPSGNRCPKCGRGLVYRSGKNGRYEACMDRECGYKTEPVPEENA